MLQKIDVNVSELNFFALPTYSYGYDPFGLGKKPENFAKWVSDLYPKHIISQPDHWDSSLTHVQYIQAKNLIIVSTIQQNLILPSTPCRYQAYELIHARWAMLGAAGAVIPEACNKFGANCGPEAVWFKVLITTSQNHHTTSVAIFFLSQIRFRYIPFPKEKIQIYTGELHVIAFI